MSVNLSNITLPANGTYADGTAIANIGESNCPDGTLMVSSTVGTGPKAIITNKCTPFSTNGNGLCPNGGFFMQYSSLSPTLRNKVTDNICVDVPSICGKNSELDINNNCITYLIPSITSTIYNNSTRNYSCRLQTTLIDNKCYSCKSGYTLNTENKKCYPTTINGNVNNTVKLITPQTMTNLY